MHPIHYFTTTDQTYKARLIDKKRQIMPDRYNNYTIKKSNLLIQKANTFSFNTQKIFNVIVHELQNQHTKSSVIEMPVRRLVQLVGNKEVYRTKLFYHEIGKHLLHDTLDLIQPTDLQVDITSLITRFTVSDGILNVKVTDELLCLSDVNGEINGQKTIDHGYTEINLAIAERLKSKHSLILYEYLTMHTAQAGVDSYYAGNTADDMGLQSFSKLVPIHTLKKLLCHGKKSYESFDLFHRKVLQVAIAEINEKTDLQVHLTCNKHSKKILSVIFDVQKTVAIPEFVWKQKQIAQMRLRQDYEAQHGISIDVLLNETDEIDAFDEAMSYAAPSTQHNQFSQYKAHNATSASTNTAENDDGVFELGTLIDTISNAVKSQSMDAPNHQATPQQQPSPETSAPYIPGSKIAKSTLLRLADAVSKDCACAVLLSKDTRDMAGLNKTINNIKSAPVGSLTYRESYWIDDLDDVNDLVELRRREMPLNMEEELEALYVVQIAKNYRPEKYLNVQPINSQTASITVIAELANGDEAMMTELSHIWSMLNAANQGFYESITKTAIAVGRQRVALKNATPHQAHQAAPAPEAIMKAAAQPKIQITELLESMFSAGTGQKARAFDSVYRADDEIDIYTAKPNQLEPIKERRLSELTPTYSTQYSEETASTATAESKDNKHTIQRINHLNGQIKEIMDAAYEHDARLFAKIKAEQENEARIKHAQTTQAVQTMQPLQTVHNTATIANAESKDLENTEAEDNAPSVFTNQLIGKSTEQAFSVYENFEDFRRQLTLEFAQQRNDYVKMLKNPEAYDAYARMCDAKYGYKISADFIERGEHAVLIGQGEPLGAILLSIKGDLLSQFMEKKIKQLFFTSKRKIQHLSELRLEQQQRTNALTKAAELNAQTMPANPENAGHPIYSQLSYGAIEMLADDLKSIGVHGKKVAQMCKKDPHRLGAIYRMVQSSYQHKSNSDKQRLIVKLFNDNTPINSKEAKYAATQAASKAATQAELAPLPQINLEESACFEQKDFLKFINQQALYFELALENKAISASFDQCLTEENNTIKAIWEEMLMHSSNGSIATIEKRLVSSSVLYLYEPKSRTDSKTRLCIFLSSGEQVLFFKNKFNLTMRHILKKMNLDYEIYLGYMPKKQ